jgi:uncharacterized membrane protein YfcA
MHGLDLGVALDAPRIAVLLAAGLAAGIFNGVAGGGTLLTFPTLLALGLPAISANITSSVGVLTSNVGGVAGFRREIGELRHHVLDLILPTVLGVSAGALLLITTPATSFRTVVPYLVLLATVAFAVQPLLNRRLATIAHDHPTRRLLLLVGSAAVSLYAGYFGAGQGVMLLAVYGIALNVSMAHLHGLRSATSILNNTIAVVIFVIAGRHIVWADAGLLAVGSLLGGWLGATVARTLPAPVLRAIVVVVGTATFIALLVEG